MRGEGSCRRRRGEGGIEVGVEDKVEDKVGDKVGDKVEVEVEAEEIVRWVRRCRWVRGRYMLGCKVRVDGSDP